MTELERIQRGLYLVDKEESEKALTEEQRESEPKLTFFQKVRQSQYWDFVLYLALFVGLTLVVHGLYVSMSYFGGWLRAETLEQLGNLPVAALIFVFATAFVDFRFLIFERIFYRYSKRNGVNTFDHQESFKHLTEWQQTKIYTIKSVSYLAIFVLTVVFL